MSENGDEGRQEIPDLPPPAVASQVIPQVVVPAEGRALRFSFKHLDSTNDKFQLTRCNVDFFRSLLERIRDYSGWTVDDFRDQNNHEHRHAIYFPETSETDGFVGVGLDADQIAYEEAWQFELTRQQDWRVHGILIDDTFFVIWLDANHLLYPRLATETLPRKGDG
jgi:hypothetical protein